MSKVRRFVFGGSSKRHAIDQAVEWARGEPRAVQVLGDNLFEVDGGYVLALDVDWNDCLSDLVANNG